MKTTIAVALFSLALSCASTTNAHTFGSGANTFNIDFVTIGNPGNAADTTGNPNPAGSVPYTYNMGKYDVSRDMITKANTLGNLGIPLADMTPYGGNGVNRPATGVSWDEAARFVNWLDTSTGSPPAYKFALQPGDVGYSSNANILLWTPSDPGYNPNNLYRNSLAHYFLPSVDEWYKAAFYGPTSGVYYSYPTGSNTAPTPVASGTAAGTAVYNNSLATGPADITLAGGLSPYGTMGQGGNVDQWQETSEDLLNNSSSSSHGLRGGVWLSLSFVLSSSIRNGGFPTTEDISIGFRVAGVAEPSGLLGDYNHNGVVDAADYVVWRKGLGTTYTQNDYNVWRAHFGQTAGSGTGASANAAVPEPASLVLLMIAVTGWSLRRGRAG